MSEPVDERCLGDYEYVPADKDLASALDTAQKLAAEADAKFCKAFGGDGETSAFWLWTAVMQIRVALSRLLPTGAVEAGTVTEERVEALAKDFARIAEGPDAGWGIYADLIRSHFSLAGRRGA